eukprot:3938050-Rhodomonas_salina.1
MAVRPLPVRWYRHTLRQVPAYALADSTIRYVKYRPTRRPGDSVGHGAHLPEPAGDNGRHYVAQQVDHLVPRCPELSTSVSTAAYAQCAGRVQCGTGTGATIPLLSTTCPTNKSAWPELWVFCMPRVVALYGAPGWRRRATSNAAPPIHT